MEVRLVAQVFAEASERLAGAEQRVDSGCMADLLTTDRVLLVVECQGGPRYAADVQVITGWVGGEHDGGTDNEGHIGQAECL